MKYKHLIFDFDGVLADTNAIRFEGFKLLFATYPYEQVNQLVEYAKSNGGLSRYEKIKYFFREVRNEPITDENVWSLAKQYSELVKQKVIDASPVNGSLEFLTNYYKNYDLAIVSGSDQEELRDVCRARGIDSFFINILGSPVSKGSNLSKLLSEMKWEKEFCVFVGDSLNDLDAAVVNGIDFIGRNSGLVDWNLIDNVIAIDDISQLHLYLLKSQKN